MIKVLSISTINPSEMICILLDNQNVPMEEHTHEFIEIEYVLSGSGVQIINDATYDVKRGDMIFLTIGDKHSYYAKDKIEVINLIFYPNFLDTEFLSHNKSTFPPITSFSSEEIVEIERIIDLMRKEFDHKADGYQIALKSYLNLLLVKFSRASQVKYKNSNNPMLNVLSYIEKNYAEISAGDVAFFSSYNASYFSKLFKDSIGISLTEYINNQRIKEAGRLLSDTDETVEQICYKIGYKDKKHFYKLFKKATGLTPIQYRTLMKNKNNE